MGVMCGVRGVCGSDVWCEGCLWECPVQLCDIAFGIGPI